MKAKVSPVAHVHRSFSEGGSAKGDINPSIPSINWRESDPFNHPLVVVAQLVRAPDCGSGGCGFKSSWSPGFARPSRAWPLAIPADSIERIDVVEGTRHYLVLGAVIGGVFFALINRYQPLGCDWKGGCDSAELMKGALFGAAIGGATGFNLHGDRWVEVRPEVLYTSPTLSGSRLRAGSKMIGGFGFSARLMLGGGS